MLGVKQRLLKKLLLVEKATQSRWAAEGARGIGARGCLNPASFAAKRAPPKLQREKRRRLGTLDRQATEGPFRKSRREELGDPLLPLRRYRVRRSLPVGNHHPWGGGSVEIFDMSLA